VSSGESGRERLVQAVGAGLPALLLAAGALLPPDRPLPFDVCLWHRLTGLPCLTCGLTRSACHLLHGDLPGSLALHPAGILVVALLAAMTAKRGLEAALGRRLDLPLP
jgi:uncharacterized protein DUF2752